MAAPVFRFLETGWSSTMGKLSDQEIQQKLPALDGWRYEAGALIHDYAFADFAAAFAFVVRLALLAEKANHHPDIDIRYNKLRVALVSHDSGGVTARDVSMAAEIGKLSSL
ncbi:MAG TPA: 4a-hydroxytetrahydrobiopterin dehydratase [Acidobacteriaceae bacterium]|nr:4a-hydroxytetrahydrobiopterin dehydratase [Acidobacteriaceae bacterium]